MKKNGVFKKYEFCDVAKLFKETQENGHFAVCMCARKILADLCDEPVFVSALWVLHISKGALTFVFSHSY